MIKTLLILPIIVTLSFFISSTSQATVVIEDADANFASFTELPFTGADISTGSGNVGDYELIACAIAPQQVMISFNDPTPGIWTQLDSGGCGLDFLCQHAIWGRFTDTADSELISCNWDNTVFVFAAGSFRYSQVDKNDPIIGVSCAVGPGPGLPDIPTAPSIETEAGSQIARIYTYRFPQGFDNDASAINNEISGAFNAFASAFRTLNVNMSGETRLQETAGPTGEAELPLGQGIDSWRACTIAIRMTPTLVPTMSEWGLISFAAFAGIAGLWYLRRRQATA